MAVDSVAGSLRLSAKFSAVSDAAPHPIRHELALIAVGMLAVADVDCR
ncbi:Ms4533A family Cys-rich leader peptide [Rhodococcus sp. BP-316]